MQNPNEETIDVCCPGCREVSKLPKSKEGSFSSCPSCGLTIPIEPEDAVIAEPIETQRQTQARRAHANQQEASRIFRETPGILRVKFRVFRLGLFSDWETLFNQATDFANKLAPESLINISHSGGEGHSSHAVTVWYWQKEPID